MQKLQDALASQPEAFDMIARMLGHGELSMAAVMGDVFFMNPVQRVDFLCRFSDCIKETAVHLPPTLM